MTEKSMLNVSRLFSYALARNSDKMIHCVEGFTDEALPYENER